MDEAPYVILFWHGRLALMAFAFRYFKKEGKRAFVMISKHKDGELIAQNIALFGLDTLRGSSVRGNASKGGTRVIKEALSVLATKNDIVITPDGPKGPFHSMANGAIDIAQKTQSKIRFLNYEASAFWQFKSWDKMILPKPFSTIIYRLSEPICILNLEKEVAKAFLQEKFAKMADEDSFK